MTQIERPAGRARDNPVAYLRRWRAQHPTYARDWMRAKRDVGIAPAGLMLRDARCDACGIRCPDRLFVCGVEVCPLMVEARQ